MPKTKSQFSGSSDPNDEAFADLLGEQKIYVLPGTIVELPGTFRLSLTANDEMIERSLSGFAAAFAASRAAGGG